MSTIFILSLISALLHPLRDLLLKSGIVSKNKKFGLVSSIEKTREGAAKEKAISVSGEHLLLFSYVEYLVIWVLLAFFISWRFYFKQGLILIKLQESFFFWRKASLVQQEYIFWYLFLSALGLALYYFGQALLFCYAEVSLYYPIIRSSPIVITLVNILLFKQAYKPIFFISMILVIGGIFIMAAVPSQKVQVAKPPRPKKMFRLGLINLAFLALFGSVLYSFGDFLAIKAGLEPAPLLFWSHFAALFLYVLFFFARRLGYENFVKKTAAVTLKDMFKGYGRSFRMRTVSVILASSFAFLSYVFILLAFEKEAADLAFISVVRQSSVFFSILLAFFFLKEKITAQKVLGSSLLFAGISLLFLF